MLRLLPPAALVHGHFMWTVTSFGRWSLACERTENRRLSRSCYCIFLLDRFVQKCHDNSTVQIKLFLYIRVIQVFRFPGNWTPPPRSANNVGVCTFVTLICTDRLYPPPHCVTFEWPTPLHAKELNQNESVHQDYFSGYSKIDQWPLAMHYGCL